MTTSIASARRRYGTFANGMEYVTWGDGPRTLLFLPGGPGSEVPRGVMLRTTQRLFRPYVDAGYRPWVVTRRRHQPPGHTVADMADDHAEVVERELGGQVDLVVGESYGGMVGLELAARHPNCCRHLALVASAARVSPWTKALDARIIDALERGDRRAAGALFGEYLVAAPWSAPVRRAIAPLVVRRLLPPHDFAVDDALVELRAEIAFDAFAVLGAVDAPVLMINGDRDRVFTAADVRETAARLPRCELVWLPGKGHVATASRSSVPRDVLAFVDRH